METTSNYVSGDTPESQDREVILSNKMRKTRVILFEFNISPRSDHLSSLLICVEMGLPTIIFVFYPSTFYPFQTYLRTWDVEFRKVGTR